MSKRKVPEASEPQTNESKTKRREESKEVVVAVGCKARGKAWSKREGFKCADVSSGSNCKLDGVSGKSLSPLLLLIDICAHTLRVKQEVIYEHPIIKQRLLILLEVAFGEGSTDVKGIIISYCMWPTGEKEWQMTSKTQIYFEIFYQLRKMYKELGHWDPINKCPTDKWRADFRAHMHDLDRKGIKSARYPAHTKKGMTVVGTWFRGEFMGLAKSRRYCYIDVYLDNILNRPYFMELRNSAQRGFKWLIIGPDGRDMLMTQDQLLPLLHGAAPCGHEFVVAAAMKGLKWPEIE